MYRVCLELGIDSCGYFLTFGTVGNQNFSPPFGRIFLELFPSIEGANPSVF